MKYGGGGRCEGVVDIALDLLTSINTLTQTAERVLAANLGAIVYVVSKALCPNITSLHGHFVCTDGPCCNYKKNSVISFFSNSES